MQEFLITIMAQDIDGAGQGHRNFNVKVEASDLDDALIRFERDYCPGPAPRYRLPIGDALFVIPAERVIRIEVHRSRAVVRPAERITDPALLRAE